MDIQTKKAEEMLAAYHLIALIERDENGKLIINEWNSAIFNILNMIGVAQEKLNEIAGS